MQRCRGKIGRSRTPHSINGMVIPSALAKQDIGAKEAYVSSRGLASLRMDSSLLREFAPSAVEDRVITGRRSSLYPLYLVCVVKRSKIESQKNNELG